MRRTLIYIATLSLCAALQAQTVEQWMTWGDAAMTQQEYYGASRFYAGALELEPGRMALQWKQAEASRLSHQYDKAADLFERVYRKDQGRTYRDALRWLGEMQLCDGRYDDAKETWQKALRKEKDVNSYTALRARNALAGIAMAFEQDTVHNHVAIDHPLPPINTFDSEFGARSGPDGMLYFSTLRGEINADGEVIDTANYRVSIVRASLDQQARGPFPLPLAMDRNGSNANAAWSADGAWFVFTRCVPEQPCALFIAAINDEGYGEVNRLPGVPEGAMNTQPMLAMTPAGEVLYFASDAAGGMGGTDIWSGRFENGRIMDPMPLGGQVNTPGNERTPWLDTTTDLLWYSSDMLPGFGGYDIFHIPVTAGTDVYPVNAGKPFNSPANDLYPAVYGATGYAWITSNRKGSFAAKGETCCNDLYRITGLPPLIQDTTMEARSDTLQPVVPVEPTALLDRLRTEFPLKLYFHNDEPEPRTRSKTTKQTYAVTYAAYQPLFDTYREANDDAEAIDAFFTDEAEVGRAKLDLLVNALIPALENGERITLDVRGHASPLALNDYNTDLSLRRIESLRNHLRVAEHGVLQPYLDSTAMNNGVLRLRVLPFGEERSAGDVSDDLKDLKRSVYSVEAARERRIEVERVQLENKAVRASQQASTYSIGSVRQGVAQEFEVPVVNDGVMPLHILRGRSTCDCVQVIDVPAAIPSGKTGTLVIQYTGRARPGPLERLIQLDIEGSTTPFQLRIQGVVSE